CLPQNTKNRPNAVIFLTATRRVTKPGDHLVKDQKSSVFLSQLAQALKVAIFRRNATHVCHDGFCNDAGQSMPVVAHHPFERANVIPGSEYNILKGGGGDSL